MSDEPAPPDPPKEPDPPDKPADAESAGGGDEQPGGASVRAAAAAAASPGGTRARNAQRVSARQNLGGIGYDGHTTHRGDNVSGTKIVYAATGNHREFRATELERSHVDSVVGTFLGRKEKVTGTVALLRGAAGSGRYATALTMLNTPSPRPTMLLDPQTVLAALTHDRVTDEAGYVLDGRDGAALTAFEVQRLDGELRDRECVLVVMVSDRFNPVDPALVARIVDMPAPPEPAAVVRAHVNWLGSRSRGLPSLTHLVDDALTLLPETSRAVGDYAALAAEVVAAAGDLDLVRRRLALRDSHDFEKWFDELPDLYTKCFAISLAALNNLPHPAVAEAARKLELLLDPMEERQKRAQPATPFKLSRRRLLDEVRATVSTRAIETRHGDTPAEVVAFVDPHYPWRLLNHVWQEHDHVREQLLDWLEWLGGNGFEAVRVAAATATGVLAVMSFDFVRASVLAAWAMDEREWCRESAAISLDGPAGDEALASTVKDLVTFWAHSEDLELVATAARACGTTLAARDSDLALQLLDEMVVAKEIILVAYCQSLAEWVGGEDAVLRNKGIAAVYDWSVDRDREKRTAGQFAFLWMAMDLIADGDPWPVLLRHAVADGEVAGHVVALWSSALVNPELSDFARRVLATWADTVNTDESAITAFVDLCGRTGNRSRAVVRHQARRWLRDDAERHCPRTAAAVLNTL